MNKKNIFNSKDLLALYVKSKSVAQDIFLISSKVSGTIKKEYNCLQGVRTVLEAAVAVPKRC